MPGTVIYTRHENDDPDDIAVMVVRYDEAKFTSRYSVTTDEPCLGIDYRCASEAKARSLVDSMVDGEPVKA